MSIDESCSVHLEKVNIRAMYGKLNVLNHEHIICVPAHRPVPSVNQDLQRFYKHNIMKYEHLIRKVFNGDDIVTLLDIIYQFMQLHERLVNKQKVGKRFDEVSASLDEAINAFENLSNAFVVRYWRHAKISILVDLKVQAVKMFKMNFVLRQYSS